MGITIKMEKKLISAEMGVWGVGWGALLRARALLRFFAFYVFNLFLATLSIIYVSQRAPSELNLRAVFGPTRSQQSSRPRLAREAERKHFFPDPPFCPLRPNMQNQGSPPGFLKGGGASLICKIR